MKSWTKPTDEQVERAIARMTYSEHRRYFFDKLENPLWVKPLWEKGLFKTPPAPVRHEQEEMVSFPFWPESRYLARMASHVPDVVAAVIDKMPKHIENVRVLEDCVDGALVMPASLAARIVPRAKKGIKSPYHRITLLVNKAGALMEKLAREGEVGGAFDLADALLGFHRQGQPPMTLRDGREFGPRAVARPHIEQYEYEQILKERFPALLEADLPRATGFLAASLQRAIEAEGRMREEDGEDGSCVWISGIESQEENADPKVVLAQGLRDAAMKAARQGGDVPRQILDDLEARRPKVFKRIALHVICEVPDADPGRLDARLLDRGLFDDVGTWHEYYHLLKRHFARARPEAQQQILAWIGETAQRREGEREEEAPRRRYEQLRQLSAICEHLPDEWHQRYEALLKEFGEPDHPDLHFWHSGPSFGPTSPRTAADLAQMPDDDIVAFLRSWRPTGHWRDPTPRGLERELSTAVSADPDRFAALAPAMKNDVDPTYVGGFLTGLVQASRANKTFDWRPVLELCDYVVHHPREHVPLLSDDFEADRDWGGARGEVARLLSDGLRSGPNEVPFDLRNQVSNALEPLTDDPDPTPDHEAKYGAENSAPYDLAINTVRGNAMEAAVLYALWCLRHLRPGETRVSEPPVLDEMPEVRAVLERHLDAEVDPSPAVRSMYGRFLPWLLLLDRPWVERRLAQIFPADPNMAPLRFAAWDTYVLFCEPYDDVFPVVASEYHAAITRLGQPRVNTRAAQEADQRLGDHLLAFYVRGKVSLDAEDSLLQQFFHNAPTEVRADFVSRAGWQLGREAGAIKAEVLQRLRHLWEFRLQVAAKTPEGARAEIAEFGSWFGSGAFDALWSLKMVERTLRLTGGAIQDGKGVCERLESLASAHPSEVISILQLMLGSGRHDYNITWWAGDIRRALEGVLSSGDEPARSAVRDLINNQLGARGFHQFRDLLKG